MELLPPKRLFQQDVKVIIGILEDLRDYAETIMDSSGEDDGEGQLIADANYAIVMLQEAPVE